MPCVRGDRAGERAQVNGRTICASYLRGLIARLDMPGLQHRMCLTQVGIAPRHSWSCDFVGFRLASARINSHHSSRCARRLHLAPSARGSAYLCGVLLGNTVVCSALAEIILGRRFTFLLSRRSALLKRGSISYIRVCYESDSVCPADAGRRAISSR